MALTIPSTNPWGASASSGSTATDAQRTDLFYLQLRVPAAVTMLGVSGNLWDSEVAFAVENFPFPARGVDSIPIKYLNLTNFQAGAMKPLEQISVNIRYAYNRQTAQILEAWKQLVMSDQNGGSVQTSAIKTNGFFYWLTPTTVPTTSAQTNTLNAGGRYYLEGVMLMGLTPSEANTTQGNEIVKFKADFQIDRYYPQQLTDLNPGMFTAIQNVVGV